MSNCPHTTVKCLCCGEEGTPAAFLAATKSDAKAAAARENGKKGGRPKGKSLKKREEG